MILIAIDGATWQVIRPLIEAERLPHFRRLIEEGASGDLASIPAQNPYQSAALWTTVATGRHPDEHGILANLMDGRPPTSNMRRVPALWNIAGDHGRRVGVVGYYVTWPPEAVEGFMVSDHGWGDRQVSFPDDLLAGTGSPDFWAWTPHSRENVAALRRFVDVDFDPDFSRSTPDWFAHFLIAERLGWIYPRDESYARIGLELLERERPDLFAIYFQGIDFTSHAFWMFHEPESDRYTARAREQLTPGLIAKLGRVVEEYYVYQDELVGRFLDAADEDTVVFVVSDHGFGPGSLMAPKNWYLSGTHRNEGIFAAWGRGIVADRRIEGASLFDMAPTILHTLGLPVGRDMRGRVLDEIFADPEPVRFVASHDPSEGPRPPQQPIQSDEDDGIRERLRALGYIE